MRQGLIFDLDGTLWDSTGVIRPVWNGVLAEHGLPPMSEEEMAGLMGLPKAALAARAFPTLTVEEGLAIMDACFSAEQREFNALAPFLMTGVESVPALSRENREYLLKTYAGYTFCPGHGAVERM